MNELLQDLYACADAPGRWTGLLDAVCERMQVRSAVVQVLERRGGQVRRVWEARDSYSLAHRHHHDLILNNDSNPRLTTPVRAAAPERTILRDHDMLPPGSTAHAELKARLAALGFGEDLHGVSDLGDGRGLVLLVHRSAADRRPIGAEEEGFLSTIMPHVRQSVRLMGRLQEQQRQSDRLAELVDMLGVGVLLCDGDGGLIWSNGAGRALLDRSPYVATTCGRLRAMRPQDRPALAALLAGAGARTDGEGQGPLQLTLGREDGHQAVQLLAVRTLRPAEDEIGESRSAVLLLAAEPGRSLDLPAESLADLFGLSAAEARIAAGLCLGLPLADYARLAGVSLGTARIQLKRALAKTGAARQSELVRRACASLAAQLRPEHSALIAPPIAWANRPRRR